MSGQHDFSGICDWCDEPIDLDGDYYIEILEGLEWHDPLCGNAYINLHIHCVFKAARYLRRTFYLN